MYKQIAYIFQFKSSILYKIGYIYSSISKLIRLVIFKKFSFSDFPFSGDFIIENSIGTFKIHEPSDMHSILNPNSEPDLLPFFQLNKGVFLDIGTNVGKYSIMIAKQNADNQVFSFEPNTIVFDNYLTKNIELNQLTNICATNKGLSNKPGTLELVFPKDTFGSASLENNKDATNTETISVEITTLDDFISEKAIDVAGIRLIKIDVEGHEFPVLQ